MSLENSRRKQIKADIKRQRHEDGYRGVQGVIEYKKRGSGDQQPTLEDTLQALNVIQMTTAMKDAGTLTEEQADKFKQQALARLEGTDVNEKRFTGLIPGTLRVVRKGVQWAAGKGLDRWEASQERRDNAPSGNDTSAVADPNRSTLTDPTWDDHLWKGSKFKRSPNLTDSGAASADYILNPNPKDFFGRDKWIPKAPTKIDGDASSPTQTPEAPKPEATAPAEPPTIIGEAGDDITTLYKKNLGTGGALRDGITLYDLMQHHNTLNASE